MGERRSLVDGPGHWRTVQLIAAGVLTLAIGLVALRASRWFPRLGVSGMAYAYLIVVVLLWPRGAVRGRRDVLLPVFWLGLCGARRQLCVVTAA